MLEKMISGGVGVKRNYARSGFYTNYVFTACDHISLLSLTKFLVLWSHLKMCWEVISGVKLWPKIS